MPLASLDRARDVAAEAGLPSAFAELHVFRALAHSPQAAAPIFQLLLALLTSDFDMQLRELIIMRIGWVTRSAYEWTQHWIVAVDRLGMEPDYVLAARDWVNSPLYGPRERAVMAATDETLRDGTISSVCLAPLDDAGALWWDAFGVVLVLLERPAVSDPTGGARPPPALGLVSMWGLASASAHKRRQFAR